MWLLPSRSMKRPVCYLEIWGCDPALCFDSSYWDPKIHQLVAILAEVALYLYILDGFFLLCQIKVQQDISSQQLINPLCQMVVISALQKLSRFMSSVCCPSGKYCSHSSYPQGTFFQ